MFQEEQLTGADLSFVLSSFKRLKDLLKGERKISREKQKRIQNLERLIDNNHNIKQISDINNNQQLIAKTFIASQQRLMNTSKKQMMTIVSLRERIQEESLHHKEQLKRSRNENNQIRDCMKQLASSLKESDEEKNIANKNYSNLQIDHENLKQEVCMLKKQVTELTSKLKELQDECNDVRYAHKETLIQKNECDGKHQLLKLQWDAQHEHLLSLLEETKRDAMTSVLQIREESLNETEIVIKQQKKQIDMLKSSVFEERKSLKLLAINLAKQKLKAERLERILGQQQQHSKELAAIAKEQRKQQQENVEIDMDQQLEEMSITTPTKINFYNYNDFSRV